jgi:hypothetical protein
LTRKPIVQEAGSGDHQNQEFESNLGNTARGYLEKQTRKERKQQRGRKERKEKKKKTCSLFCP